MELAGAEAGGGGWLEVAATSEQSMSTIPTMSVSSSRGPKSLLSGIPNLFSGVGAPP